MTPDAPPIILAIDDDPVILNLTVGLLRKKYRLRPFTSGLTAFKYLALPTGRADLILLDYQMPDLSGPEIIARLRSDPATAGLPVIFLTGLGEEGDGAEMLKLGAVDYLKKPPAPAELLRKVELHLRAAGEAPK